jgi:hypothetical protein
MSDQAKAVIAARDTKEAVTILRKTGKHDSATIAATIDRFANAPLSKKHITMREIDAITKVKDPILRNLAITQGYHDLTLGMNEVLGTDNVSWVGFATWASKTAGRFIRNEELPQAIRMALDRDYVRDSLGEQLVGVFIDWQTEEQNQLEEIFAQFFVATLSDVSGAIAYGNLKVFAELAPLFSRAIRTFQKDKAFRQKTIDNFCGHLRPGETLRDGEGGQDLLKQAFTAYYQARFETDADAKAELIMLGNCLTGLHEQIRLDGPIDDSLSAPFNSQGGISKLLADELKAILPDFLDPIVDVIINFLLATPIDEKFEQWWLKAATEFMMTLAVPGDLLRLGSDVPSWPDGKAFPDTLTTIENPQLRRVLSQYDDNVDSLKGSARGHWDVLSDRMNYIIDLFRTNQQNATMWLPPFTPTQTDSIYAGHTPAGEL